MNDFKPKIIKNYPFLFKKEKVERDEEWEGGTDYDLISNLLYYNECIKLFKKY